MSINSLKDIINFVNNFNTLPNIDEIKNNLEDNGDIKVLNCNNTYISENIPNDLFDSLTELETSLNYYLLFDDGLLNNSSVQTLNKNNIKVKKLGDEYSPFSYAFIFNDIYVLFGY